MTAPRIYLAGPDVFRRDAELVGEQLKLHCALAGAEGIYPLDGEPLHDAVSIRQRCITMIDAADILVANISPFRGHHMDPGTAWEIGYAQARGKPVHRYSRDRRTLRERVPATLDATEWVYRDAEGYLIEDLGLPENLMIAAGSEVHPTAGAAILDAVDEWHAEQREHHRAAQARRRLAWTALAVAVIVAALTLGWIAAARADIYVIDGDTVVVDREHIRLVGLNAPETRGAACEAERRLGYLAKARLVDLLTAACGPLARAPARCLDMAREPHKDRYGRSLARLRAGGEDVAGVMIREGLAEPYDCHAGHCPWRRNWCQP